MRPTQPNQEEAMSAEAVIDASALPRARGWRDLLGEGRAPVLALLLLGCWVVAADSLVTATIMPAVGADLSGFAWFGWAASGFLTGLVVAGASAGWLAERIGLRAAMMLAGAGFTIGCALSAVAPDIILFLAGRVIQGCAAGWVIGLIYVALAVLFPGRHLPRVFATLTSVWGVATFAGPLVGGLFADAGAWRGVFWLFAGQAILFTLATRLLIPRAAAVAEGSRLPVRTLVLVAAGIGCIASAGVTETLAMAALLACSGLFLLLTALAADRAGTNRLLPLRAANPAFPLGAAYLAYFATTAAGVAFSLYGPVMLQFSFGLSGLEAGYVVAIEALAWTAASLCVAGSGEVWRGRLIVLGPAAILAGATGLTLLMAGPSLIAIAIAGALLGAGYGLSYSFISQRVIGSFGEAERTRGSSAIGAVRNAGGALGAALAGIAANAADFGHGIGEANLTSIAWGAFGVMIPFALVGLVAAMRMARAGPVPSAAAG